MNSDFSFWLQFELEDRNQTLADGEILYQWLSVPIDGNEKLSAACKIDVGKGAKSAWAGTYAGNGTLSSNSTAVMNSTWFGQNRKDLLANDDSASTTTAGTTTNSRRLRGERSGYSEAFDKLKESRRKQSGGADGETDAETALKRVRGRDIFRSKGKRTRDSAKDAGETAEKAAKGSQSKASKFLSERTERKSRRQGRKLMDNAQFIEYFCTGGYSYYCNDDGTDILMDQVCGYENIE